MEQFSPERFEFRHNTVVNNRADSDNDGSGSGGGLYLSFRTLTLDHTIVANNRGTDGVTDDVSGTFVNNFSLVGASVGPLGPLADNGGPTLTHALLEGSPAIDAGDPNWEPSTDPRSEYDQRGMPFARVINGRIDVGAFEQQSLVGNATGDFDHDGDTDGADFLVWQRGFKTLRSAQLSKSDENFDSNDLAVWQLNYGKGLAVVSVLESIENVSNRLNEHSSIEESAPQVVEVVDLVLMELFLESEQNSERPQFSVVRRNPYMELADGKSNPSPHASRRNYRPDPISTQQFGAVATTATATTGTESPLTVEAATDAVFSKVWGE